MSDQDIRNDGSLVPAGGADLALIVSTNPLVLRGIADLDRLQNVGPVHGHPFDALPPASLGETTPHPFDATPLGRLYRAEMRLLALQLRLRQLPRQGQGQGSPANQPKPPVGE